MTRIRGIVFDKDGTLFDFQATWAVSTGRLIDDLAGGDDGLRESLAEVAGYDLGARLLLPHSVIIAGTVHESAEALLQGMPKGTSFSHVLGRMVAITEGVAQIEAVPLRAFFDGLATMGYRIGLATNDGEASARQHLGEAGITDHFHFVAGYDTGHGAKPGPGQIHAFCAVEGLDPAEVVMVGDSRHDLVAGRAAGTRTVGVLTGPARTEDLAPLADAVLPDIGALPGWLGRT